MKHPIVETEIEGYRAYRLESEDAQVTATFVPNTGMVGASLTLVFPVRDPQPEWH